MLVKGSKPRAIVSQVAGLRGSENQSTSHNDSKKQPPSPVRKSVCPSLTGNEVLALALLLQPRKNHLGALDVLGGVQQVLEQGLVTPGDARVLVGGRVGVPLGLPRLAAHQAIQVRALLVPSTLLHSVALGALGPAAEQGERERERERERRGREFVRVCDSRENLRVAPAAGECGSVCRIKTRGKLSARARGNSLEDLGTAQAEERRGEKKGGREGMRGISRTPEGGSAGAFEAFIDCDIIRERGNTCVEHSPLLCAHFLFGRGV